MDKLSETVKSLRDWSAEVISQGSRAEVEYPMWREYSKILQDAADLLEEMAAKAID